MGIARVFQAYRNKCLYFLNNVVHNDIVDSSYTNLIQIYVYFAQFRKKRFHRKKYMFLCVKIDEIN